MTEVRRNIVMDALVNERKRFLSFAERRTGSREIAEEILQEAFARGLERAEDLRDEASAVPWFYRVLRTRIADRIRRQTREERTLRALAGEAEVAAGVANSESHGEACGCVLRVADALAAHHRRALQRIEIDGASVQAFAANESITANNASVRLHRAKQALAKGLRHVCGVCAKSGCIECDCAERRAT